MSQVIDNLFKLGARFIYGSGVRLACMFLDMRLAKSLGIEQQNMFILNNGNCVDIQNQEAVLTCSLTAGNVFVDGLGIGDIGNVVLRDRKQLSEDGSVNHLCDSK